MLESDGLPGNIPHQCLLSIAETVEHSMGGCSGAVRFSSLSSLNIVFQKKNNIYILYTILKNSDVLM